MRKIGSLGLTIGASIVAASAGAFVFLAFSNGNSGQAAAEAADAGSVPIPDRPDWNWDVRPILSQNCFSCHGQGMQKAGLRLDLQKAAYDPIPDDKNKRAIVPGNLRKSELYKSIISTDPDRKMPPREAHKTLSARDVAVIERWIAQGAQYKQHWAYIAPTIVKPKQTKWDNQAVNEIDRYIYAKLAQEGLSPSPEVDRETLINRVTLDLTGLPPTLEEVDAFVNDKDPNAYEKLVDRLLASIEYAERQTNIWLDVARYADTRGGLNDNERPLTYPYRDWVIDAFNRNMPYDQFVTWQLAGDQLQNPTREQLLATAFLKAGRQDSEGGSIDEEFRVNNVNERTELIGKDFLGLTVGCAKCHDHKYDVIAQADYYSIAAFFNQMDEGGLASASRGTPRGATLEWPTASQAERLAEVHAGVCDQGSSLSERATRCTAEGGRRPSRDAGQRARALPRGVDQGRHSSLLSVGQRLHRRLLVHLCGPAAAAQGHSGGRREEPVRGHAPRPSDDVPAEEDPRRRSRRQADPDARPRPAGCRVALRPPRRHGGRLGGHAGRPRPAAPCLARGRVGHGAAHRFRLYRQPPGHG